ncbi:hypothetical protein ABPG73_008772 [Tetrahymena malaccensis]
MVFGFTQHQCKHDQDEKYSQTQLSIQKYFKENQQIQQDDKNRILDVIDLQPIKISIDFSQFEQQGGDITNNQKDYLISVSNTVINFVQNFIRVQPNPINNIYDPEQSEDGTCLGFLVPGQDQVDGIPNSDLHLYFQYVNNSTLRYLASAGFCNLQQTDNYIRPNFGLVEFNLANLVNEGSDLQQYQKDVQVTLHEIIHVLGFSYPAIINWYNKTSHSLIGEDAANIYITNQVLRQFPTNILGSPNVQATARKFYNCPTLMGQQLENQVKFSTQNNFACSFWSDGQGYSSNQDPFGDFCYYIEIQQDNLCNDINNQYQLTLPASLYADTLNDFSYNSKCFFSNIQNPFSQNTYQNQLLRCHFSICSADLTQITLTFSQIQNFSITCSINDQGKQIDAIYNQVVLGQITCPQDIKKFCQNKQCVNFCAYNGICIRGMCLCNQGFGGIDCSIKCVGQINSIGQCVSKCPSQTFANFDNVCRQTCPYGTYPNQNAGLCQQCDFSCSTCLGPNKNQCLSCQFLTYLYQNTCVLVCPYKTFADEDSKICQSCPKGCSICNSANFCSQCDIGFQKQGNICISANCSYPCATCSSDSQKCQSCLENLYLFNNTCISNCPLGFFKNNSTLSCSSCSIGCISCQDNYICNICDTQNSYRLQGSTCTLCTFPCATCSQYDQTYCLSCEKNYYLFNNTCITTCPSDFYKVNDLVCSQCQSGCQTCLNFNQCIDCTEGYQLYQQDYMQSCINSNSCQSPCSSCANLEPNTCITCDQNYFLQNSTCLKTCMQGFYAETSSNKCVQCSPNCSTCQGYPNNCTSCDQSSYLLENSCYSKCPTGYTYSNYLCILTRALNMNFFAYLVILNIVF